MSSFCLPPLLFLQVEKKERKSIRLELLMRFDFFYLHLGLVFLARRGTSLGHLPLRIETKESTRVKKLKGPSLACCQLPRSSLPPPVAASVALTTVRLLLARTVTARTVRVFKVDGLPIAFSAL